MAQKDLVEIIRNNPGCVAAIDNDCWTLKKDTPWPEDYDKWECEEQTKWHDEQELASSRDDIVRRGSGYGSGNCYGGDILQALAEIAGIKVESV